MRPRITTVITRAVRNTAPVTALFLTVAAFLLASGGCSAPRQLTPLTIGCTANDTNLLLMVAQDQGYFASNGLDLTLKTYASGKAAIDGMLNREVDIAAGSEYAFVGGILAGRDIMEIANINRSSVEYLVGRSDRGITDIADLNGKKVGVPMNSRPQFALGVFLYLRGLDTSQAKLVNVPVDQSVSALVNGDVDAIATWQPYIDQIKDRLSGNVVVWSVQNGQPSYNGLLSTKSWTATHADLIPRLLKSIVQAQEYVTMHPEAARTLLQKSFGYTDAYVASVWTDYEFSVSLDRALVLAMEDETRWLIKNNLTDVKVVPDFTLNIYKDGLKAVKPEAVSIFP